MKANTIDVVERLRSVEGIVFSFQGQKGEEDPSLCHEAADTIERLRAERDMWRIQLNTERDISKARYIAAAEGGE